MSKSLLGSIADKVNQQDPILNGRERIDSADTVRLFGKNGFTIREVSRKDIVDKKTGEPKHYYYIRVEEDDTVIISSGQVLTEFLDKIINSEDVGSVELFNEYASKDTFTLLPELKKSKGGNRYLDVTVMS